MQIFSKQSPLYKFEISGDVLLASWDDSIAVESDYFFESLKYLFEIAALNKSEKVLLDPGIPEGGVFTEEVMSFVSNNIDQVNLKKIGVLESVDFYWDNNLLQFLEYLKVSRLLSFEVKSFSSKASALEWFAFAEIKVQA